MNALVVDASVAVKWCLPEEHSVEALSLIDGRCMLHAPELILAEFGNVLWKRFRRGQLDRQSFEGLLADFRRVPLAVHGMAGLLDGALAYSVESGRSFYDCIYLALAEELDCSLVTADRKFFDALKDTPVRERLVWVGDAIGLQ